MIYSGSGYEFVEFRNLHNLFLYGIGFCFGKFHFEKFSVLHSPMVIPDLIQTTGTLYLIVV